MHHLPNHLPPYSGDFVIVVSLYEVLPKLILASAHLVRQDEKGELTYLQQKALATTIPGYDMELTPERLRLFALMDELEPTYIENHFRIPRRKVLPLSELMNTEGLKTKIRKYIEVRLGKIMQLVVEHNFALAWTVEHRVLIKDTVIPFNPNVIEPSLFFKQTPDGKVDYRLRLMAGGKYVNVFGSDAVILSDKAGWLLLNGHLRKVKDINARMLLPFVNKDKVIIPATHVKQYFKTFILKQARRVDIKAEGFAINQAEELLGGVLDLSPLETTPPRLLLGFQYQGFTFWQGDSRDLHSTLEFSESEEVCIVKVKRNKRTEAVLLEAVGTIEGTQIEDDFITVKGANTQNQLLEWLVNNRRAITSLGLTIAGVELEERTLVMETPTLQQRVDERNDWFDLHIDIFVGKYKIPFVKLAPYILEGNQNYPLGEGEWFLIPEEWLTKYKALAQLGQRQPTHFRLPKSQHTLLQDLNIDLGDEYDRDWREFDFQPSANLKATLRPYQSEGVKWLLWHYENDLGACLADDMGLGKTLQTIAVLLHAKDQLQLEATEQNQQAQPVDLFSVVDDFDKPLQALIVLPASLIFNWKAELTKFAPSLSVSVHTGTKRSKDVRIIERFDIVLTTYHTGLRDVELLEKIGWNYIVLDESQQIKNKDSKVFKAINQLNGKHRISLSGTPIENSLSDLWAQMQFINPGLLGSFKGFKRNFIAPIEKKQDEDQKNALRKMVEPYLLRRTKMEVAKDLPDLEIQTFYVDMEKEQKKLYDSEKSATRNLLLEQGEGSAFEFRSLVLQSLTRLRQMANHPVLVEPDFDKESGKFSAVLDQWETVRKSGHKVLFFSSFVKYLELFKQAFEANKQPYAWLTGSSTAKEREAAVNRFQTDDSVQAFFISTKAGGVGLNLTAADYIFLLDPWWNPAVENQAIARAHRIGQSKKVIARKFITNGSIEEKILRLQEKKSDLAADILTPTGSVQFSAEELDFLLK